MYKLMRRGKSHYYYRGYEIFRVDCGWKILKNRNFQCIVGCLDQAMQDIDAALYLMEL